MFDSVLMVCVGNICRSPMAEALLGKVCEQQKKPIRIASAGIAALVGHGADKHVVELMDSKFVNMHEHQAQQLTPALIAQFNLILVMERGHVKAVNQMAPESRGRVHLLGKWNNNEEIADPYQQPMAHFEAAYSAIERGVAGWRKYL